MYLTVVFLKVHQFYMKDNREDPKQQKMTKITGE